MVWVPRLAHAFAHLPSSSGSFPDDSSLVQLLATEARIVEAKQQPKVLAGKTHAALTGDKVSEHLQAIRVGCHRYGNKAVWNDQVPLTHA